MIILTEIKIIKNKDRHGVSETLSESLMKSVLAAE